MKQTKTISKVQLRKRNYYNLASPYQKKTWQVLYLVVPYLVSFGFFIFSWYLLVLLICMCSDPFLFNFSLNWFNLNNIEAWLEIAERWGSLRKNTNF